MGHSSIHDDHRNMVESWHVRMGRFWRIWGGLAMILSNELEIPSFQCILAWLPRLNL